MSGKGKLWSAALVFVGVAAAFVFGQVDVATKSIHFDLTKIGQSIYEARSRSGRWAGPDRGSGGTHVVFEISRRSMPPWAVDKVDMTILDFRHSGWDETSEYFGFCNFAWAEALQKLKQWCESGQVGIGGRHGPGA